MLAITRSIQEKPARCAAILKARGKWRDRGAGNDNERTMAQIPSHSTSREDWAVHNCWPLNKSNITRVTHHVNINPLPQSP